MTRIPGTPTPYIRSDYGCILWEVAVPMRVPSWRSERASCECSYWVRDTLDDGHAVIHPNRYCDAFFRLPRFEDQTEHKWAAAQEIRRRIQG